MSDTDADRIVSNYFHRLEAALSELPHDRRERLVEDLRDHVDQARSGLLEESPAAIYEILERIGTPEEIAAEADENDESPAGIVAYFRRRSSWLGGRTTGDHGRWTAFGAIAGTVFSLAYLVSQFIAPAAPPINANVDEVTNYINLNVHSLLASGLIETSAAVILVVFLGAMYRVLARAHGGDRATTSIVIAAGAVFAAVLGLAAIFTTSLAILGGQSVGNLTSAPYVPYAYVLRSVIGIGVVGLTAALFIGVLGVAMTGARLVGRWFGVLCVLLAGASAAGGGAAMVLGNYSRAWMVVQSIGLLGTMFVVLSASAVTLVEALPERSLTLENGVRDRGLAARLGMTRPLRPSPGVAMLAGIGVVLVVAAIVVPVATRSSDAQLAGTPARYVTGASAGSSSPSASVGYDGSAICAPTTDAATSGGSPSSLEHSATKVLSGNLDGTSWSLWSADGQSGAAAIEDAGLVFDGHAYGLCAGYPNPSETEMIDTNGDAVMYGVVNYPGRAQIQISTGEINTFSVGTVLPAPHVWVVNGVSFYIGTLPKSACSYSYFEINTNSNGSAAQHNIGFGGNGVGQGYSITNNAGNSGNCVAGKLDPLSYSEGEWS